MAGSLAAPSTQHARRKAVVAEPPFQQLEDEELSNSSSPSLTNSSYSDYSLLNWLRIKILPVFGIIGCQTEKSSQPPSLHEALHLQLSMLAPRIFPVRLKNSNRQSYYPFEANLHHSSLRLLKSAPDRSSQPLILNPTKLQLQLIGFHKTRSFSQPSRPPTTTSRSARSEANYSPSLCEENDFTDLLHLPIPVSTHLADLLNKLQPSSWNP
ncbi:hypothetical protein M5K25_001545 [Dendrobium thyrsiflorum]|uniref:Uncharacterized protein n=1 Tax=Dendrobium thyrsiflorum TaxID=117978 RepID=A0ABD0VRS0_DENTH